jgi:hypothetical protein
VFGCPQLFGQKLDARKMVRQAPRSHAEKDAHQQQQIERINNKKASGAVIGVDGNHSVHTPFTSIESILSINQLS